MLNKVILMGRLTRDPELRATAADISVATFTLAVDRGVKRPEPGEMVTRQTVDFINIVAWRGTAEFVCRWFSKGQLVAVSGRLQVRNYEDREGNKRTATEVVADEVFFAEKKGAGEIPPPSFDGPPPFRAREASGEGFAAGLPASNNGDWEEVFGDDGELPF
ncbi:MAG: single-stranded DNA-binding protein [Ruminococcaceae bacterium]|nr:single-stranded DNA-binding protein [Oscillospiraceae bacterium]